MSEFDTPEPSDDELLSAYVDGELTDDERAEVELRLADDPRTRELVDELRAIGAQMQALPKLTLGEDLRSTILQRAERTMLLGDDSQTTPRSRDTAGSRRWLWAAMAVAATLLLSFMLPTAEQDEESIASAKPVPGEKPAGEMRMEAVEPAAVPETDESAPLANQPPAETEADQLAQTQPVEAATAPKSQSNEASVQSSIATRQAASAPAGPEFRSRSAKTMSGSAVAEDLGGVGGGAGGEFGRGSAIDASELSCEVHIELGDGENSIQRINQALRRSGIATPSSVTREATDEETRTTTAERESSTRSATESTPIGEETELVLVEAPLANIEMALAECRSDTFHCPTIRVVVGKEQGDDSGFDDGNASSPRSGDTADATVARLRQWERDADDQGDAIDADAGKLAEQSGLSQRDQQPTTGRATRIDSRQSMRRNLGRSQLAQRGAGRVPRAGTLSDGKAKDDQRVQVLFVLEHAADLRKPVQIESESTDKQSQ